MFTVGLLVLITGFTAAVAWVIWQLVAAACRPVAYRRVAQFVERTGVPLTTSNGEFVLDSLARSVRWRIAGLMVAVSVSATVIIERVLLAHALTLDSTVVVILAVGFMAGAIVGEVRNSTRRGGGSPRASLRPRREADYIGAWALRIPLVATLVAAAAGMPALAIGVRTVETGVLVLGAAVPFLVSRWATRLIVERPRSVAVDADPSLLAADEGLRSRGLHAIGGPVALVATWSALSLVFDGVSRATGEVGAMSLLLVVGMLASARWSWVLATSPFLIGPDPARPSGSTAVLGTTDT